VGLDEPFDVAGSADASAGAGGRMTGSAGHGTGGKNAIDGGTGGAGVAGQDASAGSPAGAQGGVPSGLSGAAGTTSAVCTDGSMTCAGPNAVQICKGGSWQPSSTCVGREASVNGACVEGFKIVFITSERFVGGRLGGLDGADAICQRLAAGSSLPGKYRAWLSDRTGSPATRFTKSARPYKLVDGSIVANDWADLTSGPLRHPINLTEKGGTPPTSRFCDSTAVYAWTGTAAAGKPVNPEASCGDWSDPSSGSYLLGRGDVADSTWSYACGGIGNPTPDCGNYAAALYCFEQ
jgi:hypothetical protein